MGRSNQPVTLNKYLYANADPVRYVDPSGKSAAAFELRAGSTILGIMAEFSVPTVVKTAGSITSRFVANNLKDALNN